MSVIPVVASAEDLPSAVRYAQRKPASRWYVAKRAVALGSTEMIPEGWGEGIDALRAAAMPEAFRANAFKKKKDADSNGKSGEAKSAGNLPSIKNGADLKKAIGAKPKDPKVRAHIAARARALKLAFMLPKGWTKSVTAASVSSLPNRQAVRYNGDMDDTVTAAAAWDANLHPRDRGGQFISVGDLLNVFEGAGFDTPSYQAKVTGSEKDEVDGKTYLTVSVTSEGALGPSKGTVFTVLPSNVTVAPEAKARLDAPPDSKPVYKHGKVQEPGTTNKETSELESGDIVETPDGNKEVRFTEDDEEGGFNVHFDDGTEEENANTATVWKVLPAGTKSSSDEDPADKVPNVPAKVVAQEALLNELDDAGVYADDYDSATFDDAVEKAIENHPGDVKMQARMVTGQLDYEGVSMDRETAIETIRDHLATNDVFGDFTDRSPTDGEVEDYAAENGAHEVDPYAADDEVDEVTLAIRTLNGETGPRDSVDESDYDEDAELNNLSDAAHQYIEAEARGDTGKMDLAEQDYFDAVQTINVAHDDDLTNLVPNEDFPSFVEEIRSQIPADQALVESHRNVVAPATEQAATDVMDSLESDLVEMLGDESEGEWPEGLPEALSRAKDEVDFAEVDRFHYNNVYTILKNQARSIDNPQVGDRIDSAALEINAISERPSEPDSRKFADDVRAELSKYVDQSVLDARAGEVDDRIDAHLSSEGQGYGSADPRKVAEAIVNELKLDSGSDGRALYFADEANKAGLPGVTEAAAKDYLDAVGLDVSPDPTDPGVLDQLLAQTVTTESADWTPTQYVRFYHENRLGDTSDLGSSMFPAAKAMVDNDLDVRFGTNIEDASQAQRAKEDDFIAKGFAETYKPTKADERSRAMGARERLLAERKADIAAGKPSPMASRQLRALSKSAAKESVPFDEKAADERVQAIIAETDSVKAHKDLAKLMTEMKLGGKQRKRYRELLDAHHGTPGDGGKASAADTAANLRADNPVKERLAKKAGDGVPQSIIDRYTPGAKGATDTERRIDYMPNETVTELRSAARDSIDPAVRVAAIAELDRRGVAVPKAWRDKNVAAPGYQPAPAAVGKGVPDTNRSSTPGGGRSDVAVSKPAERAAPAPKDLGGPAPAAVGKGERSEAEIGQILNLESEYRRARVRSNNARGPSAAQSARKTQEEKAKVLRMAHGIDVSKIGTAGASSKKIKDGSYDADAPALPTPEASQAPMGFEERRAAEFRAKYDGFTKDRLVKRYQSLQKTRSKIESIRDYSTSPIAGQAEMNRRSRANAMLAEQDVIAQILRDQHGGVKLDYYGNEERTKTLTEYANEMYDWRTGQINKDLPPGVTKKSVEPPNLAAKASKYRSKASKATEISVDGKPIGVILAGQVGGREMSGRIQVGWRSESTGWLAFDEKGNEVRGPGLTAKNQTEAIALLLANADPSPGKEFVGYDTSSLWTMADNIRTRDPSRYARIMIEIRRREDESSGKA